MGRLRLLILWTITGLLSALWVRSYFISDRIIYGTYKPPAANHSSTYGLAVEHGALGICASTAAWDGLVGAYRTCPPNLCNRWLSSSEVSRSVPTLSSLRMFRVQIQGVVPPSPTPFGVDI